MKRIRLILIVSVILLSINKRAYAKDIDISWCQEEGAAGFKLYHGSATGAYEPPIDILISSTYNNPPQGFPSELTQTCIQPEQPFYTSVSNIADSSIFFSLTAYDSSQNESEKSLEVNLTPSTPTNTAPIASDQSVTTNEDTAKAIAISATDVDGNALIYSILAQPAHGVLSGTAPNLTYTPAANYYGADNFTFKANDGSADSNTATVSITVNAVNDAPVTNAQSVTTNEDESQAIALSATDVDSSSLIYSIVSTPAHGSLSGTAPNLTYTSTANYSGADSFTFKANDGSADSNTATISIAVNPVNDAPVLGSITDKTVDENANLIFTISGSDSDQDILTYSASNLPNGANFDSATQTFNWTPDYTQSGSYPVTFSVSDGITSDYKTIGITVNDVTKPADDPFMHTQTINTIVYTNNGIISVTPFVEDINGMVAVPTGENITVNLKSQTSYDYRKVFIDGVETVLNGDSYEFQHIDTDHTIAIGFFNQSAETFKITPVYTYLGAAKEGTTIPSGELIVNKGDNISLRIIAKYGHGSVSIDGVNIPYESDNYRGSRIFFNNVISDHTFTVSFMDINDANSYRTFEDLGLWQSGMTIPSDAINPDIIEYIGAFKVPQNNTSSDPYSTWMYTAGGLAYYPDGDPNDTDDIYKGSLFGIGHPYGRYVAEIDIPNPVISKTKNLNELNRAKTLQPFTKIDTGLENDLRLRGIEYLPPQNGQTSGKLYWGKGDHWGWTNKDLTILPNHGWSDVNLSNPQSAGLWKLKDKIPMTDTGYMMFEIPKEWADKYTYGRTLATSRNRFGQGHSGFGPSIYAIAPWQDGTPPLNGYELNYTTLLRYTGTKGTTIVDKYSISDVWGDGAWLTSGDSSAVVFSVKASYGSIWYGVGDYKNEGRGMYGNNRKLTLKFYNPADFALVATGSKAAYYPQPYATLDVSKYLFNDQIIDRISESYNNFSLAYDRDRNYLYMTEHSVEAVGNDKGIPIVHVFKINSPSMISAKPTMPKNLRVYPVSSVQIDLSWSASADDVGVTGYKIYRNGMLLSADLVSGTAYSDIGLTADTSYAYAVSAVDAAGNESIQSLSLTAITPISANTLPNNPPVLSAIGNKAVNENSLLMITLSATDVDGDTLTYSASGMPQGASLSGSDFSWVPTFSQSGSYSVTFSISDGRAFDSETINITVNNTNRAPTANNQGVTTNEGTAKAIVLSAADADGNALTYSIISQPAHGALSGTAPNLTYTPAANYYGEDNFTFKANDGSADSNTAAVSITVNEVNDAPVLSNIQDQVITKGGAFAEIPLDNFVTDADTSDQNIVWAASTPANLAVTDPNANNRIVKVAVKSLNWIGFEDITFTASDGLSFVSDTVRFTVNLSANNPPSAENDSYSTNEDTAKAIVLSAADADGNALAYSIVSQPVHGALSGTAPNLIYTPAANYNGADSFTFKANDGIADSDTATISITVNPVDDESIINLTAKDSEGREITEIMEGLPVTFTAAVEDIDNAQSAITEWLVDEKIQYIDNDPLKGNITGDKFIYIPDYITSPQNLSKKVKISAKAHDGVITDKTITIWDRMKGDVIADNYIGFADLFEFAYSWHSGNSSKVCVDNYEYDDRFHTLLDMNNDCYIDEKDLTIFSRILFSGVKIKYPYDNAKGVNGRRKILYAANDPTGVINDPINGEIDNKLDVTIHLVDSSGNPIQGEKAGPNKKGRTQFKLPDLSDGEYKIKAQGTKNNNNNILIFERYSSQNAFTVKNPSVISHSAGSVMKTSLNTAVMNRQSLDVSVEDGYSSEYVSSLSSEITDIGNNQIRVIVKISGLSGVHKVGFDISSEKLTAISIEEGNFLKSLGGKTIFGYTTEDDPISIADTLLEGEGVSGEGTIAEIIFDKINAADNITSSDLLFSNITIRDSKNEDIAISVAPSGGDEDPSPSDTVTGTPDNNDPVSGSDPVQQLLSESSSGGGKGCFIGTLAD